MTARMSFGYPDELKQHIEDSANENGISVSRLVKNLLSDFLIKEGKIKEKPKNKKLGRPVGTPNKKNKEKKKRKIMKRKKNKSIK